MTISKELLLFYKLLNINIEINGKDFLASLTRQDNNQWTFKTSNTIDKTYKKLLFKFNFEDSVCLEQIKICEIGEDYIITEKLEISSNINLNNLIQKLNKIEKNNFLYGRRKEERIIIGQSNFQLFGLNKINQQLIFESSKVILECVIADVSIHGIKIITPYNDIISKINNFSLFLSFNKPIQNICLELHKVYLNLNKINNNTYASISCQILEPINFIWKDRVINIIEKINN